MQVEIMIDGAPHARFDSEAVGPDRHRYSGAFIEDTKLYVGLCRRIGGREPEEEIVSYIRQCAKDLNRQADDLDWLMEQQ